VSTRDCPQSHEDPCILCGRIGCRCREILVTPRPNNVPECDVPGCVYDAVHRTQNGRELCTAHANERQHWIKDQSIMEGGYQKWAEEWDSDFPKRIS
jgi:hypothetical protein